MSNRTRKRDSEELDSSKSKKRKYCDKCLCDVVGCVQPGDRLIALTKSIKPDSKVHLMQADEEACKTMKALRPSITESELLLALSKRGGKGVKNHATINAKHYPLDQSVFKGAYKISKIHGALPRPTLQWDKDYQLSRVTLLSRLGGEVTKCICTLGEETCGENIRLSNGHRLPKDKKRAKEFVKRVVKSPKLVRHYNTIIDESKGAPYLFIHRRHFTPEQLNQCAKRVTLKADALPSFYDVSTPKSSDSKRQCPKERRELTSFVNKGISTSNKYGVRLTPAQAINILTPLFKEQRKKIIEDIESEQKIREDMNSSDYSNSQVAHFFSLLEKPDWCRKHTGEPNILVLRLLFEYLNYNNRLANLTIWTPKVRNRVAKALYNQHANSNENEETEEEEEEQRIGIQRLSTWEQFVLFMVIFTSSRDNIAMVAAHFDVHENTARRYYTSFTIAISHIFKARQTFPTPYQAAQCTPDRTKQALDLHDDVALYIGDCTERKIESPACVSNDLYSATFSEYKSCTTIKHNVIACGNTYVADITDGYCGAATDNGIHNNEQYGSMIRRTTAGMASSLSREVRKTTYICYLYDKGLTDRYELERHLIYVCTPRKKQNGQLAFSQQRAADDRSIARERINIERNMKEFRNYSAINSLHKRVISLSEIDLANHEIQIARGLVNLKAPITDWWQNKPQEVDPDLTHIEPEPETIHIENIADTSFLG